LAAAFLAAAPPAPPLWRMLLGRVGNRARNAREWRKSLLRKRARDFQNSFSLFGYAPPRHSFFGYAPPRHSFFWLFGYLRTAQSIHDEKMPLADFLLARERALGLFVKKKINFSPKNIS
jgi:hypothetical protein